VVRDYAAMPREGKTGLVLCGVSQRGADALAPPCSFDGAGAPVVRIRPVPFFVAMPASRYRKGARNAGLSASPWPRVHVNKAHEIAVTTNRRKDSGVPRAVFEGLLRWTPGGLTKLSTATTT